MMESCPSTIHDVSRISAHFDSPKKLPFQDAKDPCRRALLMSAAVPVVDSLVCLRSGRSGDKLNQWRGFLTCRITHPLMNSLRGC